MPPPRDTGRNRRGRFADPNGFMDLGHDPQKLQTSQKEEKPNGRTGEHCLALRSAQNIQLESDLDSTTTHKKYGGPEERVYSLETQSAKCQE